MRAPAFWLDAQPGLRARAAAVRRALRRDRRAAHAPPRRQGGRARHRDRQFRLFAGGAGKTPVALEIARLPQTQGERPAFVSRGYGGASARDGALRVDGQSAAEVGDEALLLAQVAPTFVGRDRALVAALALETASPSRSFSTMDCRAGRLSPILRWPSSMARQALATASACRPALACAARQTTAARPGGCNRRGWRGGRDCRGASDRGRRANPAGAARSRPKRAGAGRTGRRRLRRNWSAGKILPHAGGDRRQHRRAARILGPLQVQCSGHCGIDGISAHETRAARDDAEGRRVAAAIPAPARLL